jgi:hypothetical protein
VLVHKAPGYLSAAVRDRSDRGLALDPVVGLGRVAALDPVAGLDPVVTVAHPNADRGLPALVAHPAPVAHLGVRFVRPTHARPFSRPKERGGSDTTK